MKKFLVSIAVLSMVVSLFILSGCGEKTTAKGKLDLLTYIPADASGLFLFDFDRFSKLEVFDSLVKEGEKEAKEDSVFNNYQDFVTKTGIDPKKDVFGLAVGFFGDVNMSAGSENLVVVANLNYDKEKLLTIMKEKGAEYSEEAYGESTLYKVEKEKAAFSFLSGNLAVMGKVDKVKAVIDLMGGKGDNVYKSESLKDYIKKFKSASIMSFAFVLPDELKKVQGEGSPMQVDLTKAEAVLGFADYNDDVFNGEIKLISKDEEANKQVVTTLNGLKGMGAMAGPEVAELLNNLTLSSSADNIKLSFSISRELIEKLQAKAKEKTEKLTE